MTHVFLSEIGAPPGAATADNTNIYFIPYGEKYI